MKALVWIILAAVVIAGAVIYVGVSNQAPAGNAMKTCSSQNGRICSNTESCSQLLQASDSQRCCAVNCTNATAQIESQAGGPTFGFLCKKQLPIKIAWASVQDCGVGKSWYKETQDKIYYKFTHSCTEYDYALNIYDKSTGDYTLYSVWSQTPEPCYVSHSKMESYSIGHSPFGQTLFGNSGEKYSSTEPQPSVPEFLQDYPNWYSSQWGYGWHNMITPDSNSSINGIPCTKFYASPWCIDTENCLELYHFNINSISEDFSDSIFNPPEDCAEAK